MARRWSSADGHFPGVVHHRSTGSFNFKKMSRPRPRRLSSSSSDVRCRFSCSTNSFEDVLILM